MTDSEDPDEELLRLRKLLGEELRRIREQAKKNTRQIGKFSTTHISMAERGLTGASEDLVAEYIKLGGDRVRLLSMLDAINRVSKKSQRKKRLKQATLPEAIDPQTLTPDSNPHELRRLYQLEEQDDLYVIGANKAVQRATHLVRVRPLTPQTRYYVNSYGTAESSRRGVLSLHAGQGCKIARLVETDRGVLHFVLDFNPSGAQIQDRLYEFTFIIDIHDDDPMVKRPMLRNSTKSGIRRVLKRVQFTEPAVPRRIWWFRKIELLETDDPPQPEQLLPLNSAHLYFHDFPDTINEYVGLAWEWA